LLDEQFFGEKKFFSYLKGTFIPFRAVRGEEIGDALYKQYAVHVTPTVLITTADGDEIDRVIGYGPPADEFKTRLEETYHGEDTFLNLSNALKSDPDNLALIVKMGMKYDRQYNTEKAGEYFAKALEQPAKARKIMVPFGREGKEVSAYEYAKYTQTSASPEKVAEFIAEFPESIIKGRVLSNLSRFYRNSEKQEAAFAVFEKLVKKYPDSADLISPYLSYCLRSNTNIDRAIELADRVYSAQKDEPDIMVLRSYAELLLKKGSEKKAAQVFGDDFVKQNTDDAGMLNYYASFWASQGKNLESALRASEKSLKLEKTPYSWNTQGTVFWKMGKYDEAVNACEEALKLDPEYSRAKRQIERIRKEQAEKIKK